MIDQTRQAAQEAKEKANEHMKNSWEAFGNHEPGTVIRQSLEAWESLRESDKLAKQATMMENSNISYYDNERK